ADAPGEAVISPPEICVNLQILICNSLSCMFGSQMADANGWLTLREACARLDVHPATLRQWADRGRLRAFRTPGGHRRFSAEDVEALLATLSSAPSPEVQLLLDATLGRARRELSAGRLTGEAWWRLLDPGTRERY